MITALEAYMELTPPAKTAMTAGEPHEIPATPEAEARTEFAEPSAHEEEGRKQENTEPQERL
jgi:hypothetical protein